MRSFVTCSVPRSRKIGSRCGPMASCASRSNARTPTASFRRASGRPSPQWRRLWLGDSAEGDVVYDPFSWGAIIVEARASAEASERKGPAKRRA